MSRLQGNACFLESHFSLNSPAMSPKNERVPPRSKTTELLHSVASRAPKAGECCHVVLGTVLFLLLLLLLLLCLLLPFSPARPWRRLHSARLVHDATQPISAERKLT